MKTIKVTKNNFNEEVAKSQAPVLVDFWAPWCGPCKMLGPVISEIAEENPDIKVAKVNIDEEPELAAYFQISSIPTVMAVVDGKIKNMSVGFAGKEAVLDLLK